MTTFGIWCRRPSFDDITLAAGLGFKRLDIMIGDMSKQRTPTAFELDWPRDRYKQAAELAFNAGIEELHYTAWAMPHVTYMAYAGDTLQQLCIDTGAHGIVLDAEEPYTQAKTPDYGKSCEAFFEQAKGCRVGITGIGFCNTDKLQPLMAQADYGIPQAYVVAARSGMPPGLRHGSIDNVIEHWREFDKPIVPALAAYRQAGIDGLSTRVAMGIAREHVRDFDTVLYWSLRQVKGNTLIRNALRQMIDEDNAAKEGAA